MVMNIVQQVEKKLNLPPLSKVMDKIPDAEQLRLTKDILGTVERLMHEVNALPSDKMERLERIMAMVYELYSMPVDRMQEAEKVLKRVEKIIKSAPEQLLSFLEKLKE